MPNTIRLYQAVMLLALSEERGTMNGAYVEYATAAALLSELLMHERIAIETDNKNKVLVMDDSTTDDALLDEALDQIKAAKRQRKLQDWVQKLGQLKDLKHKVAQSLADAHIVAAEKEKVLWLFERRVYPELNPEPEQQIREAMRSAVMSDDEVEPRVAILVALANSAKLLPQVFTKQELKQRKKRIEQLEKGEMVSAAAKQAVAAIEAAVMVAAIMPAITAASTASCSSTSC
ncbi:GPP34 family phosphoprotein [Idiomarina sp.]|uniref:GOLPH3/VPS74 family protein n=1 Tax=Idiomarina sp. TaxID=1874361 RepID=UPI002EA16A86|nr:GPP34 family phosphoprotein [Pseudomonadota bacterium]MEC9319321.1 GPP34 family phosphoprotein [Pseudomonadota bacterium]|tara:strand:- start:197 stop:895 length:699 start_codon:yes stop_codon:yes gene_type:complete